MSQTVLAIAAHPDDVEIGCAGALYQHVQQGDDVHILITTDGRRSADPEHRHAEQVQACEFIGAQTLTVFKWDEGFQHTPAAFDAVHTYIKDHQPDLIYTHYGHDTHQEHRAVFQTVISAARPVPRVLLFEDVTSLDFAPQWYTPLTELAYHQKMKALKAHASQMNRWRRGQLDLPTAVETMVAFRGSQIGVAWAEAFVVHRYINPNS